MPLKNKKDKKKGSRHIIINGEELSIHPKEERHTAWFLFLGIPSRMKPDSPLQYPSSSLFDNSLKMISSKTGFPSLIALAIWNGGEGTEQVRPIIQTNKEKFHKIIWKKYTHPHDFLVYHPLYRNKILSNHFIKQIRNLDRLSIQPSCIC